jgi:UDP-N-acetylglucosamine--N-acetylmuramyl-(pentapeptide) pyrophosphoryl-undecaprenol N-acetylglucosamine transferase
MSASPPPIPSRIAIAAGGTAGHVMPAIVVAQAYREAQPAADIVFVGAPLGLESRLVPAAGFALRLVDGAPLFGVGAGARSAALVRLGRGVIQARRVLQEHGSQLVIGFGGYATAGTLLAARTLRLPIVIHEGNAAPGLANRLLGRLADRVLLAFAAAAEHFRATPTEVVGFPVAPALREVAAQRHAPPPGRPVHVLVTGGSLGSSFLNQRAPVMLGRLAAAGVALEVLHQAGQSGTNEQARRDRRYSDVDIEGIRCAYRQHRLTANVVERTDDMVAAYAWADVAVSCGGSASLHEIAAAALPALIVPLAAASENHQQANAEAFARQGAITWVSEQQWDDVEVSDRLRRLCSDTGTWQRSVAHLRCAAPADAARRIVAVCESLRRRRV